MWVTSFGHGLMVGNARPPASAGALQINAANYARNGTMQLTLPSAVAGAQYILSATSDFSNWTPLATQCCPATPTDQFNSAIPTPEELRFGFAVRRRANDAGIDYRSFQPPAQTLWTPVWWSR